MATLLIRRTSYDLWALEKRGYQTTLSYEVTSVSCVHFKVGMYLICWLVFIYETSMTFTYSDYHVFGWGILDRTWGLHDGGEPAWWKSVLSDTE